MMRRLAVCGGLCVALLPPAISSGLVTPAAQSRAPKTPHGLPRCEKPLTPVDDLPRLTGERLRYHVEVIGLPLGTVDFEVARRGRFRGQPVTEYRGRVDPDPLVEAMVTIEGSAAALVPESSFSPVQSLTRYRLRKDQVSELQTYDAAGRTVVSKRSRNGSEKLEQRQFHAPVQDLVTGFYLLRRLPRDTAGCTVVYANHKAYTIWVTPEGRERVDTPKGERVADRYRVRYGSDRTKMIREARVWISTGPERIPYLGEALNPFHPVLRLQGYRRGH